jgi:hypothetical protein
MNRPARIALIVIIVVVLFFGYLLFMQWPERVHAPTGFRGPTGPPKVQGPSGPPPGN